MVLGKGDILEGVFSSRKRVGWGGGGGAVIRVTLLGSGVDVHACVYAVHHVSACP